MSPPPKVSNINILAIAAISVGEEGLLVTFPFLDDTGPLRYSQRAHTAYALHHHDSQDHGCHDLGLSIKDVDYTSRAGIRCVQGEGGGAGAGDEVVFARLACPRLIRRQRDLRMKALGVRPLTPGPSADSVGVLLQMLTIQCPSIFAA